MWLDSIIRYYYYNLFYFDIDLKYLKELFNKKYKSSYNLIESNITQQDYILMDKYLENICLFSYRDRVFSNEKFFLCEYNNTEIINTKDLFTNTSLENNSYPLDNIFNDLQKDITLFFGKDIFSINYKYHYTNNITILRVNNTDYLKTKEHLNNLYNKIIKNGIIILEYYNFPFCGQRKAVDEFRLENKINNKITNNNEFAAYWVL